MIFKHAEAWISRNSLWLVGFGLMLASSGLDGAYMSLWMANDWKALGYVLNTMSDITGMVLTYHYGLFQQSEKVNHRVARWFLGVSEIIAVFYSWLFSWRQLRFMLPAVETNPVSGHMWEVEVLTGVAAGFIPLMLAIVGYAQAMKHNIALEEQTSAQSFTDVNNVLPDVTREPMEVTPEETSVTSWVHTQEFPDKRSHILSLLGDNGYTQHEIANIVGCSRGYVNRIANEHKEMLHDNQR